MNAISPEEFKETVRSKTDIVQLIGESVALKPQRGGRLWVGLCPFHDDHNPSMQVNPERQTYKCWSCGAGGDCFSFLMALDNLSFREVLVQLAERARLELPTVFRPAGPSGSEKADLYAVLEWAERQYHECLLYSTQAEAARRYLHESRGFTTATIAEFRLGYHPDDWGWLLQKARGKYSEDLLVQARVAGARDSGGAYDYFVNRVMFPIRDERGRVVAFGGRVLPGQDDSKGKYWNSPESPLFVKSKLCFGLEKARETIKRTGSAIIVEGYTDCIKAHQAGVRNVVATLGTALTESHVAVLKRFAGKVILIYDGDEAGRNAAERALARLLAQDIDLRILTLPDGLDPDEFLDSAGPLQFQKLAEEALEAWDYKWRILVARHDLSSSAGSETVVQEMLQLLQHAPGMAGTNREAKCLQRLQQRCGISEQRLRDQLRQQRRVNAVEATRRPGANPASSTHRLPAPHAPFDATALNSTAFDPTDFAGFRDASEPSVSDFPNTASTNEAAWARSVQDVLRRRSGPVLRECEFVRLLFTNPDRIGRIRQQIGLDELGHPALRELVASAFDFDEAGESISFDRLLSRLESPALKNLVVWIADRSWLDSGSGRNARADSTADSAYRTEETEQTDDDRSGRINDPDAAQNMLDRALYRQLDHHLRDLLRELKQSASRESDDAESLAPDWEAPAWRKLRPDLESAIRHELTRQRNRSGAGYSEPTDNRNAADPAARDQSTGPQDQLNCLVDQLGRYLCRRLVDTDLHNEPTADFDRWQLNEGIRLAVQTELTRAQDARLLDEIVGQIRRASEQRRLLVARNQSLDTQSSSGSLSREHLELLRKADSLHRERAVQPPTTD